MRILVIPDVHLKPWMFQRASELMRDIKPYRVVCLMDIADDWGQTYNLELYAESYDAAIAFSKAFPETLWCYGNHDLSYLWNMRESGYSPIAPRLVNEKLRLLREALPDDRQLAYIHRIDNVLFLHGGLLDSFVRAYVPDEVHDEVDLVVARINSFGCTELWQDCSPIWCRPQYDGGEMYLPDKLLQVVGHTPVPKISLTGSLLSCDVFSTYRDRTPIGTQQFLILDTVTREWTGGEPFSG